jgi:hypothetical protein
MADPNFKNRRTPGVYVSEISAFPPSAVGVETAVPVFIGYTERAEISGVPAAYVPVRIASMMEFEQYFGGSVLDVRDPGTGRRTRFTLTPVQAPGQAAAAPGGSAAPTGPAPKGGAKAAAADKGGADQGATPAPAGPPAQAAPAPGTYDLAYRTTDGSSVVYAKLTPTVPLFSLHNSLRLFYANGGGPCYIVSVGSFADALSSEALVKGLEAAKDTMGPTILVIPDASLLPVGEYGDVAKAMMKQAHDKQDRVALLDVPQVRDFQAAGGPALGDAITAFRASVGTENLSYGIAYFPYLKTTIVKSAELDYTIFPAGEIADYLLAEWQKIYPPGPSVQEDFRAVRETMKQGWPEAKEEEVLRQKIGNVVRDLAERDPAGAKQLEFLVSRMTGGPKDAAGIRSRNQDLVNVFPQLTHLYDVAARQMNLLPASVAMAGVMTVIDNTRGVWNAPANIALNAVEGPAFGVNDDMQADLNKPLDGKAINVIREFVGRGPIVWGARTLDGNSGDYRYVQVRRTLIYIEQSIKAAMNPFVFAANDGKTWVSVVAMVSNFLQNLWARGGLMGTTPQEAFSVNCGLGSTMSAQDVLEGYMVVQVLVQLIHPAEFIELTFKQKMEAAG